MISGEPWSRQIGAAWDLARRFQKFLAVGVLGLALNQGALFLLAGLMAVALPVASPIAIFLSMILTFSLNEAWTWHDRGSGRLIRRALWYGGINSGGLLINWGILLVLDGFGVHYLLANLIGAAIAAVWNFSLNNLITWRE